MNANGHSGADLDARRPLAIDLFAGAGGLSLGLEQAGFDVIAAVEYDPVHAATHEFNFPLTETVCTRIEDLRADELRAAAERGRYRHGHRGGWNERIDLIVGGPPCQGFSLMGKRLVNDPRNQLVFHFFRLVKELRPRYFVMENVPGMNVGGHAGILGTLISEFEREGYRVVKPVRTLNAAEFAVPQERHRLFVLGAAKGQKLPTYPGAAVRLAGANGANSDDLTPRPTVWDAIGDLPDLDEFKGLLETDEVRLNAQQAVAWDQAARPYARRLRSLDHDPFNMSHPRRWHPDVLTSSMRTQHTALSIARFSATAPGAVEPVSRFQRLHPDGRCNTIRAGTGSERGAYTSPRPIHPLSPRVISVREAARLHSFPDWFRFHRTKWHGFRQVGNAVAPLVARAIGFQVAEALRVCPPIPTRVRLLGSPDLLELTMTEAGEHFGVDPADLPQQRTREKPRVRG